MRTALLTLSLMLIAASAFAQPVPAEFYHSLDELYQELYDLEAASPERIAVDSVGHSEQDNLPILLVKISDDVAVDYDRPTVLIVGHIHGEEILGIEIILEAITQLTTDNHSEFRGRREQLEMYFIPTMNPEGLQVVFGDGPGLVHGPDRSYRKNKHINMNDGVFKYQVGLGNDTSGVDLNRNWGLNWFHGDSLFHYLDEAERYDYYRGAHPFSESETRVVREMHELVQPLYGITYHSSRSGTFSEKLYYPWKYGGEQTPKYAPDIDVLSDIGDNCAAQIIATDGGHYVPAPSSGRNAKMHDWTYAAGNWINLEIEVGLAVLQPDDEAAKDQIVEGNLPGIYYLMDRARGLEDIPGSSGYLEVHVQDQQGQPLVAEVFTPDFWDGYLSPRYTDPIFGVHRRPLLSQNHTIITRAFGYGPDTSVVYVGPDGPSPYTITLTRKPHSWLHLRAIDVNEDAIPATFIVHRDFGSDTLDVPTGDWGGNMPHGDYTVEMWSDGYIPKVESFTMDGAFYLRLGLVEPDNIVFDDFEAGVPPRWTNTGDFDWAQSGFESYSGDYSLKSDPDLFLDVNTTGTVTVHYDIPTGLESLALTGMVNYDLEPDYDFCYVQISSDGSNWTDVDTYNGVSDWRQFLIELQDYLDEDDVYVRWTVTTDESENDRGVFLDDMALLYSSEFLSVDEETVRPLTWTFHPAYPNPFNPSTRLSFDLAEATDVTLIVYDLTGREVVRIVDDHLLAGPHHTDLDMSSFASGMYFARINAGPMNETKKIVLMK
ncbi:MAG TPA: T9SS type A sorting domain-containing protein [Bacteroidetes bacterium]|nr:zinc carboxypeptidase precursor [bacterium BMS3Bbin04]HDO65039.1 T9SS type A sorting domain-containing protein [Bacteroidota bacterium]HEX04164.1 T9SS type A sorting domain-containing protein [Bacteroidota bacterium]